MSLILDIRTFLDCPRAGKLPTDPFFRAGGSKSQAMLDLLGIVARGLDAAELGADVELDTSKRTRLLDD